MKILWVKSGPLYPLNTGGRKRTHAMLTELSQSNDITFLAFADKNSKIAREDEESNYAGRKHWVSFEAPPKPSLSLYIELLRNFFFSPLPWALEKWVSPAMVKAIQQECHNNDYTLLICDFLYPALNVAAANIPIPTILFQHNMESQIWERMAEQKRGFLTRLYFKSQHKRFFRAEKDISSKFAGIITVSPEDTRFSTTRYGLTNILGDVPTGVDTAYFRTRVDLSHPKRLGFLGSMDWMPNIEAVLWFSRYVLPLLHEEDSEIELVVIGRNPPSAILNLADSDSRVTITGTVDDVRPFVEQCKAVVVPLLSGGGTRIKILEALALGVPVVSTAIGAEGLSLTDGEHIIIADTPEEFASSCKRLIHNEEDRLLLSRNGRSRVVKEHSWSRAATIFQHYCEKLLSNLPDSTPRQ